MDQQATREGCYLYSFESEPNYYYYTGKTKDGRQVLVTFQIPHIVALFFDEQGNFLSTQKRMMAQDTWKVAQQLGLSLAFRDGPDAELIQWLDEMCLDLCPISVKRFFLTEYHIGILDFPNYYRDIIQNPENYSEDDRRSATDALRQWAEEGQFVLFLDEETNYWIDHTGRVVTS